MSINQVIAGKNRITEFPNRWQLNQVATNVYDVEQVTGEVTETGTPYSKQVLDKIDNVLSYLTPSVEKVQSSFSFENIHLKSASLSQSANVVYTGKVTGNIDGENIGFEYNLSNIRSGSTSALSSWSENQLNDTLSHIETEKSTSYNIILGNNKYIKIDLKQERTIKLHYQFSNTSYGKVLYGTTSADTELSVVSGTTTDVEFNARYIEIRGTNNSGFLISILNIIISQPTYQNQFTLDNNGTEFQNNQRVLIETDKNVEETEITYSSNVLATTIDNERIDTYNEKLFGKITPYDTYDTDIIPTYEYHTTARDGFISTTNLTPNSSRILPYNSGSATHSKIDFLNNEKRTSWDSSNFNIFDMYRNENVFIDKTYDFKQPVKIKINYRIKYYNLSSAIIEASNDNINWTLIDNISNDIDTIKTIDTYYRYYRLKFTNNTTNSNGEIDLFYTYVSEIKYIKEIETPYQDISSNTLNGINISTLLQPSTKYELIYKEDTNKFELGGLLTLFDITLTENVNQVDLTGLSDMLKDDKLYAIIVVGALTSSGVYTFGSNDIQIGYLWTDNSTCFTLFTATNLDANTKWAVTIGRNGARGINSDYTTITGYEYIKGNFKSGTRIIIKEVA